MFNYEPSSIPVAAPALSTIFYFLWLLVVTLPNDAVIGKLELTAIEYTHIRCFGIKVDALAAQLSAAEGIIGDGNQYP